MIETSQFMTLVAVAKAGSFSKAADNLGVTQSAISQSIKNLETKVGVKLFRRAGKRVILTLEGERLHSLGADFLHKMSTTLDEIKYEKDGMSGKIRIGALTGIGKSWLAPIMFKMLKQYPNLSFEITLGFETELVRDFDDHKLDIMILLEDLVPDRGENVLLGEEMSTLIFPQSKEFDVTLESGLDEITSKPTILYDGFDHLYFNWCRRRFNKNPRDFTAKFVMNSHDHMLQAVSEGIGVAVVPTHVLNRSEFVDKVRTLGEEAKIGSGKFYLVYHKEAKELHRISYVISELMKHKFDESFK